MNAALTSKPAGGSDSVSPITAGRNQWKVAEFMYKSSSNGDDPHGALVLDFTGKTPAGLGGRYFEYDLESFYFWFNLDGGSTNPPHGGGWTSFPIAINTGDSAAAIAAAAAPVLGTAGFHVYRRGAKLLLLMFAPELIDGVGGSATGLIVNDIVGNIFGGDDFYDADLSLLSNHQILGFGYAEASAFPTNLLCIGNTQAIFGSCLRRGRFTPAGSSYFKQVWRYPLDSDFTAWNSGTAYSPETCVTHLGAKFVAIQASTNKPPSSQPSFWKKFTNLQGSPLVQFRTRYFQPVTTEIACTPDVPIDFEVPPWGQIWLIADKATDFPVGYVYDVSLASEVTLRALISGSVGVNALAAIKTVVESQGQINAALSRYDVANTVSAVSFALKGGIFKVAQLKAFET